MPVVLSRSVSRVAVLGGGTAYPSRELTNAEVLARIDPARDHHRLAFAAEGVRQTIGVWNRAWSRLPGDLASDAETTDDLAVRAGRAALADAAVAPDAIDVLIVATSTPSRFTSTTCSAVGAALGVRAMAFDLRSGCAGALFAVVTAAHLVAASASRALVIGVDTFSKVIPPGDPRTALTMGDGAAAIVLGPGEGALLGAALVSDGVHRGLVHTPGPLPPTPEAIAAGAYLLHGDPDRFGEVVEAAYAEVIGAVLRQTEVQPDRVIPQQSGRPILERVRALAGVGPDRVFDAIDRHANCGAASALGAWVEARREGWLSCGDRALITAVGGGISAAALVWSC